jgi:hypothetical protein
MLHGWVRRFSDAAVVPDGFPVSGIRFMYESRSGGEIPRTAAPNRKCLVKDW